MSEMGQARRFEVGGARSGSALKPDLSLRRSERREGPTTDTRAGTSESDNLQTS